MPGPCNKSRKAGSSAAAPNKKSAARLAARRAAFFKPNDKFADGFHMPGSQNRNK